MTNVKVLGSILALAIAATLGACGGGTTDTPAASPTVSPAAPASPSPAMSPKSP